MSLPTVYGYPTELSGECVTVVAAGDTVEEFHTWAESLDHNDGTFEGYRAMTFTDKLQWYGEFGEYKGPVVFVKHTDDSARQQFMTNYNVVLEKSQWVLDRHRDMMHKQEGGVEFRGHGVDFKDSRTIEEMHGLDEDDPWDRRTEEEKKADEETQKKMEEAAKQTGISGPFKAPEAEEKAEEEQKRKGLGVHTVRREGEGKATVVGVDLDQHTRKGGEADDVSEDERKDWDPDLMDKIEVVKGNRSGDGFSGQTSSKVDEAKRTRTKRALRPEDFGRALAGDTTSTIASTESWGRHNLHKTEKNPTPDEVKDVLDRLDKDEPGAIDELMGKYTIIHAPETILKADNCRSLLQEAVDWSSRMCDGWVAGSTTGVLVLEKPEDAERMDMKLESLEVEASHTDSSS